MLYSGIDLHKRTAVITTVDESGKVVAEASVRMSRADVARFFQWLPEPTVATVEATSSWYWLRDLLDQEDVPLAQAPGAPGRFLSTDAPGRDRDSEEVRPAPDGHDRPACSFPDGKGLHGCTYSVGSPPWPQGCREVAGATSRRFQAAEGHLEPAHAASSEPMLVPRPKLRMRILRTLDPPGTPTPGAPPSPAADHAPGCTPRTGGAARYRKPPSDRHRLQSLRSAPGAARPRRRTP